MYYCLALLWFHEVWLKAKELDPNTISMFLKLSRSKARKFKILITALVAICIIAIKSDDLQAQPAAPQNLKNNPEIKGKLKIFRDIRYASAPKTFEADSTSDRKLDIYRPIDLPKGKLPVIVFIHGGGFGGGDKKGTEAVCTSLSNLGYAVVSINYRLELKRKKVAGASASANMGKGVPENGFNPALSNAVAIAAEDAQLALKWIKENAESYNLNTAAVAISGGSAGGMTALYTAYATDQKILPIKAVVNLWGGLEKVPVLKKKSPALLTYHGDLDNVIHVDFAYVLHKEMQSIGHPHAVLHVMEGKGHARYDLIAKEKAAEIDVFLKKVF